MSSKKGFNEYKIIDNYVIIYIKKRTGEIIETFVDLECLQNLIKLDYSWNLIYSKKLKNYYVKTSEYLGIIDGKPKYKTLYLHRILLNYRGNKYIDHEDHNTLNNRKSNLKIVTQNLNMKNGKDQRKNNISGERNVGWDKNNKLWLVQLQVNGKNTLFGKFKENELDKAKELARKIREEIYKPEFEKENYDIENLQFIE